LAPSSARASCGDYVIVNGRGPNVTVHHGAMPAAEPGRSAPVHGPTKPCSGPTCSARQHVPIAPAPSSPPPPAQAWGPIGEPLDFPLPSPTARVAGDRLLPPGIIVRTIFHPPRFSA